MILALLYDFGDALLVSIFSTTIVFAILYLITLAVRPLKHVSLGPKPAVPVIAPDPAKPFDFQDIKDDDMMVAALVAAIDYRETTHQDVHINSIKEIKSHENL